MFSNHHTALIFSLCIMIFQASLFASDSNNSPIIKPILTKKNSGPQIEFEFSIKEKSDYYISFAMYGNFDEKYHVLIDGHKTGVLCMNADGLQNVFLKKSADGLDAETVHLKTGTHTITILGNKEWEIPNILDIKIGMNHGEAKFSSIGLPVQAPATTRSEPISSIAMSATSVASAVSDPGSPYYEFTTTKINNFLPTYTTSTYFRQGDRFSMWAILTNGTFPQIYLFYQNDPVQGSWNNISDNSIIGTANVTGTYRILVTTSNVPGYCYQLNLILNGGHFVIGSDFWALPGTKIDLTNKPTAAGTNFFTCNSSAGADPIMYLLDRNNRVVAWNDDRSPYEVWGRNSHCNFSGEVSSALLIAFRANTVGSTDLYAWVKNDDYSRSNYMRSSTNTQTRYNCYAWTGGITSTAIDPTKSPSPYYYGTTDDTQAFNNYYGNRTTNGSSCPRYAGAMTYESCNGDDPQACIDLLGYLDNCSASGCRGTTMFYHATVSKNANAQFHGYAWESKEYDYTNPKNFPRYFHPRFEKRGEGDVRLSYKPKLASSMTALSSQKTENPSVTAIDEQSTVVFASTPKMKAMGINHPLSFDESIALGLTTLRNAALTDEENKKIEKAASEVADAIRNEYYLKLAEWEKTRKDFSLSFKGDQNRNSELKEHCVLKDFYKKHKEKVWPLLIKMVKEKKVDKNIIIEDGLLNIPVGESIIGEINEELSVEQYTQDGALIFTTNDDRCIMLCKKMLQNM